MQIYNHPELELLYHVPNGGSRNRLEAANLQKQGEWLQALAQQGYKALCCEGWIEASKAILVYLSLGGQQ